ncbi:MAG: DUF420 domain-containing protein [Flavobacteriales bacterium]
MMADERKARRWINALSIGVPVVVALLFGVHFEANLGFLPHIYAWINGLTFLVLLSALLAIHRGRRALHALLIKTAFALSAVFLVMYILYHATSAETPFGGQGWVRPLYYALLISHILLSVLIIPLALRAYLYARLEQFEKHKRIAPWAIWLWMYMAASGVGVYLLISPYYPA